MAQQIAKRWNSLLPSTRTELKAQQQNPLKRRRSATSSTSASGVGQPTANTVPALDASLLEAVRKLGRKPVELKHVKTDAEKDERSLAQRYRRSKGTLLRSTVDEVEALSSCPDMLEALRRLGRKPVELKHAKTTAEKDERSLAQRYRRF